LIGNLLAALYDWVWGRRHLRKVAARQAAEADAQDAALAEREREAERGK